MKILAIDPATKCGWAHSDGPSGVWDLSVRADESGGMRLVRFSGKLREVIRGLGVDVIAYEKPTVARGEHANTRTQEFMAKLAGIIEYVTEISPNVECRGYNLQTIKSHALRDQPKGSPRNKEAMVAAAKRRWPDFAGDDNEADAKWLLDLAARDLGAEVREPRLF